MGGPGGFNKPCHDMPCRIMLTAMVPIEHRRLTMIIMLKVSCRDATREVSLPWPYLAVRRAAQ